MWAEERSHRIMSLLATQARLETDSLAEALNVSRETIRRDLLKLEAEGKVRRVHGGVVPVELPPEKPFEVRRQANAAAKQRIAKAAARMIEPGQCCFVDAGTTTAAFATELAKLRGVSVITNSLDVARILRNAHPEGDILLLGGQLGIDVPATYGEITISQIERFRPDTAIISPVGLHPEHGATDYFLPEAEIARAMIANAGRLIMLADRSKLGEVSRVRLCGCDAIDVLIVDQGENSVVTTMKKAGVKEVVQV
jgi:DeoR/GlpR family transcriptional regulator of sugar metabolism